MIASANSLIGVARWGSILIGPAFAGFLYAPAGSATVFAVDAASFLVSASFVWKTRPRRSFGVARIAFASSTIGPMSSLGTQVMLDRFDPTLVIVSR